MIRYVSGIQAGSKKRSICLSMIRTKKYLAILQITRDCCRIDYRNGIGISEILQEDIAGLQIQRARSKKLKKKKKIRDRERTSFRNG